MSDDDGSHDLLSYACLVEKETEKAIRASVEGRDEWYPKSQLDSWPPVGERGTIVLPRWLALNNGLPDPAEESTEARDAPPSEDWRSDGDERPTLNVHRRVEVMEHDQAKLIAVVGKFTHTLKTMAEAIETARGHVALLTKRLNELEGVDDDEPAAKY